MEYMGDKAYWDEKFKNRGKKAMDAEESLVENLDILQPGSVLDVACGDGRNSLFLAKKDFDVTAIDFSEKALERLRAFADEEGLRINTAKTDLSKNEAIQALGMFDNIVVNHYRPDKRLIQELKNHLREGGIFFISGFGEGHEPDVKVRKEDLITSTDFEEMKTSFDLIKFEEKQDDRGYFVTYVFRRK